MALNPALRLFARFKAYLCRSLMVDFVAFNFLLKNFDNRLK